MFHVANAFKHVDINKVTKRIMRLVRKKKRHSKRPAVAPPMVHSVSCPGIAGNAVGLRQCAEIIKIAQEMDCTIYIAANHRYVKAVSILELLKLHIGKGTLVVLTIKDGDTKEVLQRCIDVMGFLERS